MAASETSELSLEAQLEMLRSITTADAAQRVQDGILARARQQRRQIIVASTGAGIATLHFILQGDPLGYFALTTATAVLLFVAWRSAHQATNLAALKSGASLIARWTCLTSMSNSLAQIFSEHCQSVYRLALSLSGIHADAENIAQEVFVAGGPSAAPLTNFR